MHYPALCQAVLVALLAVNSAAADRVSPPRETRSDNGRFLLRIERGQPGGNWRPCRATLYEQSKPGRRGKRVWQRAMVNDVAPQHVCIRDDGHFVVTLNEHERGGARHALVIYGERGELLRHFMLSDLLTKADWQHVKTAGRSLDWLSGARFAFDDTSNQFVVRLKWGREVRIDLRTLHVLGDGAASVRNALRELPTEVLAALFDHLAAPPDSKIAERLAELSPAQLEQAEEVAAALAGEVGPQDPNAPAALPEPDDPNVAPAAAPPDDVPPAPAPVASTPPEPPEPTEELATDEATMPESFDEAPAFVTVPEPDPAAPVDYVAWLNDVARFEGPDARPLYEEASELAAQSGLTRPDVLADAMLGDPAALASPEFQTWLDANAEALALFREASRYDGRSFAYHSESGAMIEVLLPSLSPLRDLAKTATAAGRALAAQGAPEEAAVHYLDVLAAGSHTSDGLTLIEDLVGVAMQAPAAEGLLDLAASPSAQDMDFAALADEAEVAYRTPRSTAESIQGERAFFMDTVQRVWTVDPDTGATVLDMDRAREFAQLVGDDPERVAATVAALVDTSYEDTVAAGEIYFDALSEVTSLPYPQANEQLRRIEDTMAASTDANPFLKAMAPSLSRFHFIKTRSEAVRRATLLVTRLQAYRQQHGDYPDSLAAFGDRAFSVDPFSNDHFVYRREGDRFVLYSPGGNLIDDGGQHDARAETGDLVFWPRPE